MEEKALKGIESDYLQIIILTIGGKKFGIDIKKCRDVNKNIKITEVPKSSSIISGIVNIRGEIITVIELSELLGYALAKDKAGKNIVIRLKNGKLNNAIRADEVENVLMVKKSDLEDASNYLSELEAKYINYVTLIEKQIILLLDVEKVFNDLSSIKT